MTRLSTAARTAAVSVGVWAAGAGALLAGASAVAAAEPAKASGAPRRYYQMEGVQEIADSLREDFAGKNLPLGARLAKVSERFLGTPYRLGPLGEGPKGEFDRGPLLNLKAVDCTTFVEQTMAFALAREFTSGVRTLHRIRYKGGSVGYETRNHFPAADWIPNNVAAGFLRDITRDVAGDKTKTAAKTVKKAEWYAKKTAGDLRGFDDEAPARREERAARWRRLGGLFPDRPARLEYLPIELLPEFLSRIPSGTIANLVREDRPDKPTLVSHQVFIFDGPKGKVVRHAASGRAVEDAPALEYFYRYFNSDWRLLGLNLNAVQESRGR